VPGSTVDSIITSVPAAKFLPTEVAAEIKKLRSGLRELERGVGTHINIILLSEINLISVEALYLPELKADLISISLKSSITLLPELNNKTLLESLSIPLTK
jgi:hypothetical protein